MANKDLKNRTQIGSAIDKELYSWLKQYSKDTSIPISKLLDNINGSENDKYIFINTNIIHYSKYYNIYKSSDISVPVL